MSTNSKTLHVIDSFGLGGAQTHLYTMLAELLRRGHDPADHPVWSLTSDGAVGDDFRELGVEVTCLELGDPLAGGRLDVVFATIARELTRVKPGLVECHLTYSRLLVLPTAAMLGISRRIGFEQGDIYLNKLHFNVANFIGQFFADKIIVCSDALGEWNREHHKILRHKLATFHNCVDVERFVPRSEGEELPELPGDPDAIKLVTVGSLGSGVHKCTHVSIKAAARARELGANVNLYVCGDGPLKEELIELTRELGVQDSVFLLGWRRDVPEVMKACDVYCHASLFEPFGIVAIEGMASGLPAIVPDSGGISEACVHGKSGFVYPVLDHEAMASYIVEIASDPARLDEMKKVAREHTVAHFTVETYVDKLEALYASV